MMMIVVMIDDDPAEDDDYDARAWFFLYVVCFLDSHWF